MRRLPILALFGLLAFALAGFPVWRAAAQSATPAAGQPRQPGDLGAASREFNALSALQPGTLDFQFRVALFDSTEHAHDALGVVGPALRSGRDLTNLTEQPLAGIADEAIGFTGQVTQGATVFRFAVLVVRDGVYDHAWTAAAIDGDPLGDLLAIARRRFGGAGAPPAVATPLEGIGGLLDRLPTLADLPSPNFRLIDEHTENAAGTPTP